jgi:4-amino-4-deoxy-L-arabinose transferase-like glycosyltransferase
MKSSAKRTATVVELRPRQDKSKARIAQRRFDALFLTLIIIGAALLRLDFMRAADYVIDADEAIVGLMAQHIVAGSDLPTFYYGQHYMGSLEPLCAAALFALFGESPFVLQVAPLLFSLALVYILYQLGREVGGHVVGRVAALLCAFPPVALVVWSYKARGGFIELLVIGALAILFTVRWLKKNPSELKYPLVVWLLLGLGWWVNNQILYFIAPIALVGAAHVLAALRSAQLSLTRLSLLCGGCLASFLIGSAPYWMYNIRNNFPSLGMFGFAEPEKVGGYFLGLINSALPILLGAKHFWEATTSFSGATAIVYTVYGVVFATVLFARRKALAQLLRGEIDRTNQVELFFFLIVFACAVFTVSTFGWLSQAPRYLLPLYIPLFIICGVWAKLLLSFSRSLAFIGVGVLLTINLASCYWGGRALPGEPVVFDGERVSRDHTELNRTLESLNIHLVRTNYWIGYRLAFETNERVKFLVLQEPRQVRIPEYQKLPPGVTQDEVPLLLVPGERALFVGALNTLGYTFQEKSVSGYVLVYDIKRPAMNLQPINSAAIESVKGSGSLDAKAAVDGSESTRWATGAPQSKSQTYEVAFTVPQSLASIRYSLGGWPQDYPRGLQIEVEDSAGNTTTVLASSDYPKLAAFFTGSDLQVWFPPVTAKRVRFIQAGTHPILDWSIAELSFYSGSVNMPPTTVVKAGE